MDRAGPARVVTAVRDQLGDDIVKPLYDALGERSTRAGRTSRGHRAGLAEADLPAELAAAAHLGRVRQAAAPSPPRGRSTSSVTTSARPWSPSTVSRSSGQSSARPPRVTPAGRLWDGCVLVADTPGFFKIEAQPRRSARSSRPAPDVRVHVGGDHAACDLHQDLLAFLEDEGHEVTNHGPQASTPSMTTRCSSCGRRGRRRRPESLGIVRGSGNGEDGRGQGRRHPGGRCCDDDLAQAWPVSTTTPRSSPSAVGCDLRPARSMVRTFLATPFSGEARHARRMGMESAPTRPTARCLRSRPSARRRPRPGRVVRSAQVSDLADPGRGGRRPLAVLHSHWVRALNRGCRGDSAWTPRRARRRPGPSRDALPTWQDSHGADPQGLLRRVTAVPSDPHLP